MTAFMVFSRSWALTQKATLTLYLARGTDILTMPEENRRGLHVDSKWSTSIVQFKMLPSMAGSIDNEPPFSERRVGFLAKSPSHRTLSIPNKL
jgi:hypothetical protein